MHNSKRIKGEGPVSVLATMDSSAAPTSVSRTAESLLLSCASVRFTTSFTTTASAAGTAPAKLFSFACSAQRSAAWAAASASAAVAIPCSICSDNASQPLMNGWSMVKVLSNGRTSEIPRLKRIIQLPDMPVIYTY